ncbi:MAG TPA: alcohol dehydrogenase catalytic domain-containing protein [Polyangiaceae bacterium]|jgi:alcohol dehydrogenase|nr:alcohol dehydrogenase catalytic domain-containing protein [Polyangiaceae bacterium]
MRAFVCDGEPRLVRDYPEPPPRAGEALVELRVAGICHTDLELSRGYMGFRGVLGHEFVGDVLSASNPALVGKRVVADINAGCGACDDCRRGNAHHCGTRTVLGIVGRDGAMSDRFTVPESCLVTVPDSVPDDAAVFAEPLAAALHVLDDIAAEAGPIVVLGDGKLGQLVARALVGSGRETTLVGRHESKLGLARAAGARALLESELGTELDGSPMVVEATGRAAGIALALRLTRPRGTVVLKTTVAGQTSVDLSPIVINELRVVGSRCGDLARAVALLAAGRADPTPLIAARYSLDDATAAFSHAAEPGVLKVLLHRTA